MEELKLSWDVELLGKSLAGLGLDFRWRDRGGVLLVTWCSLEPERTLVGVATVLAADDAVVSVATRGTDDEPVDLIGVIFRSAAAFRSGVRGLAGADLLLRVVTGLVIGFATGFEAGIFFFARIFRDFGAGAFFGTAFSGLGFRDSSSAGSWVKSISRSSSSALSSISSILEMESSGL